MDIDKMKNARIDKEEFVKQNNERIRKSGNYAEVTICIETGSSQVIPYCRLCKTTTKEIAMMIDALKKVLRELEESYPKASFYANFMMKSEKEDL